MPEVVLDASLALDWVLPDEGELNQTEPPAAVAGSYFIVPSIWWIEVANAILVAERRQRFGMETSNVAMSRLKGLVDETDRDTASLAMSTTLAIARQSGLSVYDAAYLELAMRRRAMLATGDRKLADAARAAGVALL